VVNKYGIEAKLACLAIRIFLDFDTRRPTARDLDATLVQSHMRVAIYVTADRQLMETGYGSEPILAEAAAQIMNEPLLENTPIKTLAHAFADGFIARGERGELMQRLLWTMAHDQAAKSVCESRGHPQVKYHRPVPVVMFLKALVNPDWHDVVLNALPVTSTAESQTLQDAFDDAYINFSHFVRAEDSDVLDCRNSFALLLRGAAIQCRHLEKGVDSMTLIHFGEETPISYENTSYMQTEVKNCKTADTTILLKPNAHGVPDHRPVLSIVAQLGDQPKGHARVEVVKRNRTRLRRRRVHPHDLHYQINLYGCSSDTYAVLTRDDEADIRLALACRNLEDGFPYAKDDESTKVLRLTWTAWDSPTLKRAKWRDSLKS